MATVIGTAGNSANVRVFLDRYLQPALVSVVFICAVPGIVSVLSRSLLAGSITLVASVAVSARMNREMLHDFKHARKWRQGAEGEMLVGRELAQLPDTYVVLHDFNPVDSNGNRVAWNVDHIVIGPTGVFVIETKNYSQTRVTPAAKNRYTRDNVKQVDGNAFKLKQQLVTWSAGKLADQFVQPLLVYTQQGAFVEQPFEGRVKVIPLKWLANDVTGRTGNELDPDVIYRIAMILHSQLRWEFKRDYQAELDRFGAISKAFKLQRAEERRAARLSAQIDEVPADKKPQTSEEAVPKICPQCGAPLVRRVAMRGDRKGKAFMGCSQFGRTGCRYVLNLS